MSTRLVGIFPQLVITQPVNAGRIYVMKVQKTQDTIELYAPPGRRWKVLKAFMWYVRDAVVADVVVTVVMLSRDPLLQLYSYYSQTLAASAQIAFYIGPGVPSGSVPATSSYTEDNDLILTDNIGLRLQGVTAQVADELYMYLTVEETIDYAYGVQ